MSSHKSFVRRFTPCAQPRFDWLVLVGGELREFMVVAQTPDEGYIRRLLQLPSDVDIVIGRP